MQDHQRGDRLSWADTVFLHLEREGMPLNVASVCVLEGEIPFATYLRFVESKLPLIPRYLKRVVSPAFGLGLPSWEYDPTFNIHNHVRELRLQRGTDAELKAVAGKILSKVMDRQHPLWDLTLIHGLKGNRTGLIIRLHHCLADGIAGVGVMNVLFDASPVAPPLPRKKLHLPIPKQRDPLTSLVSGVVDSYSDVVKRILSAVEDMLSMAEQVASKSGNLPMDEFSRLLPELTAFTERLRFNVPYRGPQKFTWTEVPLAEVKSIRQNCGTSVNDVILALLTATIRRYSEFHGDRVKGKLLRMMVPVNLRGREDPNALGNRISLVPVTIPLNIRDPRKLLAAAHERTTFLKQVHAAELVSLAGGLIGFFPTSLQALAGPIASQLPITPFNLVCTNVPGPQCPLYLLGHELLRCYPYVPVGGEMAVNCAILSYNGTVYFGFSGDVYAAPDLGRLEKFLQESFAELRDAASGRAPQKKKTKRVRAKASGKTRLAASQKAQNGSTAAPPPSPQPAGGLPVPPQPAVEPPGAEEEIGEDETLLAGVGV
jgi:diacylglycerol O-acyltransferase / wax synthase